MEFDIIWGAQHLLCPVLTPHHLYSLFFLSKTQLLGNKEDFTSSVLHRRYAHVRAQLPTQGVM